MTTNHEWLKKVLTEAAEAKLESEITSLINNSVAAAENSPDPTDATGSVYANPIVPTVAAVTVEPAPVGEQNPLAFTRDQQAPIATGPGETAFTVTPAAASSTAI